MKRSGFARKLPERKRAVPVPMKEPARATMSLRISDGNARMCVPVPKFAYVRSDALMRAYRAIACQHCHTEDGTVCGAHSNWAEHGKGRSIKASDVYCASLCHRCHMALDQGAVMTEEQRYAMWSDAHRSTVIELSARGLWPQDVPLPEVV
jgi:hypothetical protein